MKFFDWKGKDLKDKVIYGVLALIVVGAITWAVFGPDEPEVVETPAVEATE